jgi:hypothetical protein
MLATALLFAIGVAVPALAFDPTRYDNVGGPVHWPSTCGLTTFEDGRLLGSELLRRCEPSRHRKPGYSLLPLAAHSRPFAGQLAEDAVLLLPGLNGGHNSHRVHQHILQYRRLASVEPRERKFITPGLILQAHSRVA